MAWEQRALKRYYYRSERVGGRPVRRYVGTGPAGELAAAAHDLRRLEREVAARERQTEQARQQDAEAPLLQLCQMTDALTRAALLAAGYRQHARGAWRRCRDTGPAE